VRERRPHPGGAAAGGAAHPGRLAGRPPPPDAAALLPRPPGQGAPLSANPPKSVLLLFTHMYPLARHDTAATKVQGSQTHFLGRQAGRLEAETRRPALVLMGHCFAVYSCHPAGVCINMLI
jgi:hypothetical protein